MHASLTSRCLGDIIKPKTDECLAVGTVSVSREGKAMYRCTCTAAQPGLQPYLLRAAILFQQSVFQVYMVRRYFIRISVYARTEYYKDFSFQQFEIYK